jgi:hypothetical protein
MEQEQQAVAQKRHQNRLAQAQWVQEATENKAKGSDARQQRIQEEQRILQDYVELLGDGEMVRWWMGGGWWRMVDEDGGWWMMCCNELKINMECDGIWMEFIFLIPKCSCSCDSRVSIHPTVLTDMCLAADLGLAKAVGEAGGPAESGKTQDPRAVAGSAATCQEERGGGLLRRGRMDMG